MKVVEHTEEHRFRINDVVKAKLAGLCPRRDDIPVRLPKVAPIRPHRHLFERLRDEGVPFDNPLSDRFLVRHIIRKIDGLDRPRRHAEIVGEFRPTVRPPE